jgi:hypothetical protein
MTDFTPVPTCERGGGQRVELKLYSLDGSLVMDFGVPSLSPLQWDLRNGNGKPVADGIYWVVARVPGERTPQVFKLVLVR